MAILLASIVTIGWLCSRAAQGQVILPYAPRRPVPWTWLAPTLMLGATVLGALASLFADSSGTTRADAQFDASFLWALAAWNVFVTGVACLFIAAVFDANQEDLGWPASWRQLRSDVGAGVAGFLAALAPVYAIQWVLVELVKPETIHPVLEQFATSPTLEMALATTAMAVVGAPVFEETAFRLVFQGWVESWSEPRRGSSAAVAPGELAAYDDIDASGTVATATREGEDDQVNPTGVVCPDAGDASRRLDDPAAPTRWGPIVASALLFSFVHIGQNVAPISLFPLGLILGYLYQRTHRLAAPMACHAAFNAHSVLALWLNPEAFTK